MNHSLTGWSLILTAAGACFAPLIAASGVAYRQQAIVLASFSSRDWQQPQAQQQPRYSSANSQAARFQEIMNPGPMATPEATSLARAAWYCLACERDYRQQMLYPGEDLNRQPCETMELACDDTLSEMHRVGLLRILSHKFQSHGLDNDAVVTNVMGGGGF